MTEKNRMRFEKQRRFGAALALAWALPLNFPDSLQRMGYLKRVEDGQALFESRCRSHAGIRIYKTVPEVDGVLLLKVRPPRGERELSDPQWPGAAFGREYTGEAYIASFLGYEHPVGGRRISERRRGMVANVWSAEALPGYRWVETVDGTGMARTRHVLRERSVMRVPIGRFGEERLLASTSKVLESAPSSLPRPRYGVTFEDHVIPEERALWVASSTVKVIDLKTNELLGEMTRYAVSYLQSRYSSAWLNHSTCPEVDVNGDQASTRQFVDRVLIPLRTG